MRLLCVVDMQNDFITGSLGTPEAEAIVPNVVKKLKEYKDDMVICTYDDHFGFNESTDGETIEEKVFPSHCLNGTEGWQLISDIHPLVRSNNIYSKEGRFMYLKFPETIRWKMMIEHFTLESIEIIGLCTDICVLSNALLLRSAFPEIPIKVDSNCCAGTDKESHEMALKIMKKNLIEVI